MGGLNSRWPGTAESLDRALVIACAVIWLLVVGIGVAAAVALTDLGRGHSAGESGSGTSWLLYVVIAVSALVIVSAVPLLLRARNTAKVVAHDPVPVLSPPRRAAAVTGDHESPGYVEPNRARVTPTVAPAILDRIWLRCGAGVIAATGAAMLAVAVAAYLLAVDSSTAAWVALGVAALITLAMCAIPVLALRQLQTELGSS